MHVNIFILCSFFKMSINCVAKNCISSIENNNICFFKFPTEKDLCDKWLDIIDRADLKGTSLEGCYVCSLHCLENNFSEDYLMDDVAQDFDLPSYLYNNDDDDGTAIMKQNSMEEDMIKILEKEGEKIVFIEGIGFVRLHFKLPDDYADYDDKLTNDYTDYDDNDISNEEDTNEDYFQCAHCSAQFEDFNFLKIHVHQHSLINNKTNFGSTESNIYKDFKNTFSLLNMKPKFEDHQCNECGKNFMSVMALKNHASVHSGCRPFICTVCDKRFALLLGLKNHIQTTHSDRRYICKLCGKAYMSEHYLRVHLRIHSGTKMFQCIECNKPFVDQPSLKLHMRTHTGERPYVCGQCDRAFTQQSHLKTHTRLHTGERPFTCDICKKAFRQISNLIEHRRRHARFTR